MEEEFNDFWKKLGCTLSTLAVIALVFLLVGIGYLIYKIWYFIIWLTG
jgi:hypothetical protein